MTLAKIAFGCAILIGFSDFNVSFAQDWQNPSDPGTMQQQIILQGQQTQGQIQQQSKNSNPSSLHNSRLLHYICVEGSKKIDLIINVRRRSITTIAHGFWGDAKSTLHEGQEFSDDGQSTDGTVKISSTYIKGYVSGENTISFDRKKNILIDGGRNYICS